MSGNHLCPCGLSVDSAAPRCKACPQVTGAAAASYGRAAAASPAGDTAVLMTYSRWRKSTGTFGPAGRVIATLLLLVPLPVFAMAVSVGIGIIGGGIYVLVIMPWALKDIWKRAAIPVRAPALPGSAPSAHRF